MELGPLNMISSGILLCKGTNIKIHEIVKNFSTGFEDMENTEAYIEN